VNKATFITTINDLVKEYKSSPEYLPPVLKKRWVSWHFVGYWALSLGIHISLKHGNIEIHLPFGFIRISFRREAMTYYSVSISV